MLINCNLTLTVKRRSGMFDVVMIIYLNIYYVVLIKYK
jgi:hypothetical protein